MNPIRIIVMTILAAVSVVQFASAGQIYTTSGKSVGSYWTANNVPAGAVVHSVATATVEYTPGPTEWFFASLPSGYWVETTITTDSSGNIRVNIHAYGEVSEIQYNGKWDVDSVSGSASMHVGIAGPPAGLVHEASVIMSGGVGFLIDEKTSTLAGGTYQIYHGGGVSTNGYVTGITDISW